MMVLAMAAMATPTLASASTETQIAEPNPKTMTQAEIRAFNQTVDREHPFYIKCKRSVATGSLMARLFSCRTNAQWAKAEDVGNQDARDTMEEMQSKSWNTSG